jgi:hypothetical protein
MATITLSIDDTTEKAFREVVRRVLGNGKGRLGEAATEAMNLWVREKTQEALARDALDLLDHPRRLGARAYRSRSDLHDR